MGPIYSAEWLGANLERVLDERGLTASDAADALDIARSTVGRWIRSESFPTVHYLAHLCSWLAVGPDELLGVAP